MTERVEECKNDWLDGTCPQCGETHYVIVRREEYKKLKADLAQAEQMTKDRNQWKMACEMQQGERFKAEAALARVRAALPIAAAPALLEALEAVLAQHCEHWEVIDGLNQRTGDCLCSICQKARAAIAQAKGAVYLRDEFGHAGMVKQASQMNGLIAALEGQHETWHDIARRGKPMTEREYQAALEGRG